MNLFGNHIKVKTINVHESRASEPKNAHVSGRITKSQREQIEELADLYGLSMSEVCEQAITFYLMFVDLGPDKMARHRETLAPVIRALA